MTKEVIDKSKNVDKFIQEKQSWEKRSSVRISKYTKNFSIYLSSTHSYKEDGW
jgi:phage terminase small subunit